MVHSCNDSCVCPLCGEPLLYNAHHNIHACPSPRCRNRAGLTVVPSLPTLAPVEW